MNRPLITRFAQRLKRIGVEVELVANYPWIYMTKVNGIPVTEKFMANHGFTAFFGHQGEKWSDRRVVFKMIRQKVKQKSALDEMVRLNQEIGLYE